MKRGIIGPGYLGVSKNINASRCINFYPVLNSEDSKSVSALVGTPGVSVFTDQLSGPIRGMHVFNGLIYFVSGNKLYSINNAGVMSDQLGDDLALSDRRVTMADNGLSPTGANELAIADGENIYIYDVSTETMTTLNIDAKTIAFINGYFVADIGGMQWQTSNLYDGTTWDSVNKSTADGAADDVLTVINNHGELWLFGEYTTEIWYLTGSASPLFARITGGVLDYGTAARYSIAKGNNTIFWLATQRNNDAGEFVGVAMANGYNAQIISTEPINQQIGNYDIISDAFGYCYSHGGHTFYVLTFPTQNVTWVYDVTTGLWHEWSSYSGDPYKPGRHLGNCYVYYVGKHYMGDYMTGKIYELSLDYYDDAGEPIVSTRITDTLDDKDNLSNLFVSKLQIDAETGTGGGDLSGLYYVRVKILIDDPVSADLSFVVHRSTGSNEAAVTSGRTGDFVADTTSLRDAFNAVSGSVVRAKYYDSSNISEGIILYSTDDFTLYQQVGQESDSMVEGVEYEPSARLSWSDDGGHSWSNEYSVSMGKTGEYSRRLIWRRLGKTRGRIFKITISDAIKKVLIAMHIDTKKGNH